MNKKLIAVVALSLAPMGASYADNDVGCGWGTQIWQGNSGVFFKMLASFTNGSFGNQTFGITSGTAGCGKNGTITANTDLVRFASGNIDALSADMARGEGEALTTLATLYGVAEADRGAFYRLTQAHYGSIFVRADVTAGEVVTSVRELMAKDAKLARYAA
ncbi:MAG: DUF3015 family protein [Pseudomonadota bacterium]